MKQQGGCDLSNALKDLILRCIARNNDGSDTVPRKIDKSFVDLTITCLGTHLVFCIVIKTCYFVGIYIPT